MVSPRNSRSKSLCTSSRVTGTLFRASSRASIAPAGPPPTIQQEGFWTSVTWSSTGISAGLLDVIIWSLQIGDMAVANLRLTGAAARADRSTEKEVERKFDKGTDRKTVP